MVEDDSYLVVVRVNGSLMVVRMNIPAGQHMLQADQVPVPAQLPLYLSPVVSLSTYNYCTSVTSSFYM
jgi:hypothetical protein